MTDQVNTLSVRAILDSADYARGGQVIGATNAAIGKSSTEAGTALTQIDLKATSAGGGLGRLTKAYDQAGASQMKFQSDLRALNTLIEQGKVSTQQATVIYAGMAQRLGMAADGAHLLAQGYGPLGAVVNGVNADMARHAAQLGAVSAAYQHQQSVVTAANSNIVASNRQVIDSAAQYRRQNLGMQLFDIGQSASLGAPIAMILAQQGPQIAQLYAAQGGLNAAMRDFVAILGGVARVAGPVIAALAGLYGVYKVLQSNSVAASLAVDDATRALAEQAAPVSALKGQISDLTQVQLTLNAAIADTARTRSSSIETIIANSQREYEAKKALLELELVLQEAKLRTQQADIAIAGQGMKERLAQQVATDPGRLMRDGFSDPAINGGIPFVRIPDEISGLQKTFDAIDTDPAKNEIIKLKAEMSLAELIVQKLREALTKPFTIGAAPTSGVPVPTAGTLVTTAASDTSLLQRGPAGGRMDIVGQIQARQQLAQTQNEQIQQLQLEAQLVGASTSERARATAALQAEQQLRQSGISLLSQEGQLYRDNAIAMAQARVEIERQNAAYGSMQQAGTSALSSLITGTGTLSDRLKATASQILTWVQQMTLVNPLSNSMFGTNLPTMGDLFSGRPSVPGMTSTAQMMVTATTVMINGGVMGSQFPSIPGVPANVNGVRPDLISGGLVNSPLAANQNIPANLSTYAAAVRNVESSNNYSALGPVTNTGDRAYGAYQIMGNNVPSWSQQALGRTMTPQELLADKAAQDAIFADQTQRRLSQYGSLNDATAVHFTGRPMSQSMNAQDQLGTTTPAYVAKVNDEMARLSQTTSATTSGLTSLNDSTKTLSSGMADVLGGSRLPATAPAIQAQQAGGLASVIGGSSLPATSSTYFPPAPTATASFNPASLLRAIPIFGPLMGSVFGFADGTPFAPGGLAMVGERGPELVNLPRGSQVIPNHKIGEAGGGRGGPINLKHEFSITVAGNGDKELMERMRVVAEESARAGVAAYDQMLPDRIEAYQMNPNNRGGIAA